ncbi:collagenase [Paludibacterium purpuratum]|uniref:microbial collagenase n=1 Tax=Paludibacterium purpuratum TaxID=1144873 RepID=A0A4R7AZQ9_9NEIS|nr:collagenase [Paludibacterium purpuratum]TDR73919.1 microbial collagenase [Paludibacterium purpuratum]
MPLLRLIGITLLTALWLPTALAGAPEPGSTPIRHGDGKQLAPPRLWHTRPPTADQAKYWLPDSKSIVGRPNRARIPRAATPECKDVNLLAGYRGAALANYLMSLPDAECVYGLFSLSPTQASTIYQPTNLNAVARQFSIEAQRYNASSSSLVLLTLYLRAGYYLAGQNTLPALPTAPQQTLRPSLHKLMQGSALFEPNAQNPTTAAEAVLLISNMHDELNFLDDMRQLVRRYTATPGNPDAVRAVRESSVARAMTSVQTVFYMAHYRGASPLSSDPSYAAALYQFVINNRAGLLGTESAFLLGDAARESMRFLQYPALKTVLADEARGLLAASSMTGPDNEIWLAAAQAIKYYDNAHCADYGTCNFESRMADAVLGKRYTCSPTIKMRAQELTVPQFWSACQLMEQEERYFHQRLKTGNKPVADDRNTTLEVVVFDDYDNYAKYASVFYGIDTNNGGMYEEGNPTDPANQARFIAYEASWLRPNFVVWNLQHEYVHYLDGRFDMYGDFAQSTRVPTVWWIEGLAEYLSKRNDNPKAIAAGKTGQYALSQIFGNTYAMPDYVNRAYNWGYLATRYMFEKHPDTVDRIVNLFRNGQYDDYQALMRSMGSADDAAFAQWVATLDTKRTSAAHH